MKKFLIFLVIVGVGLFAAYKWGIGYASERVIDQLTKEVLSSEEIDRLMKDPEVQAVIRQELGTEKAQEILKDTVSSSEQVQSAKLMFESKEDAFNFLLDKFSFNELRDLASLVKDGFTAEEKAQIEASVKARMNLEEFEALKIYGLIELLKQQ